MILKVLRDIKFQVNHDYSYFNVKYRIKALLTKGYNILVYRVKRFSPRVNRHLEAHTANNLGNEIPIVLYTSDPLRNCDTSPSKFTMLIINIQKT